MRGAYIETEKARSGRVISSLQPSKASTDQAYDSAVALLLREIHGKGLNYIAGEEWRRLILWHIMFCCSVVAVLGPFIACKIFYLFREFFWRSFIKPPMSAAYPNSAAAFIATHNRDSVEKAVALMEDLNIPRNDKQYVHPAGIA